jgi:ATP-dependent Clp protease ATP-binding subunit ClpA
VKFGGLGREIVLMVVDKAIREFQQELAVKSVTLEVTDRCREWLADRGYSPEFGAREVARLVASTLKDFFVEEVLFGRLASGGRARADVEEDKVVLAVLE